MDFDTIYLTSDAHTAFGRVPFAFGRVLCVLHLRELTFNYLKSQFQIEDI